MQIRTAEMQHGGQLLEMFPRIKRKAKRYGVKLPPPTVVSRSHTVNARVNWGRWIVECPCRNAEFAWVGKKLHMCTHCWNQYADGMWIRVHWPSDRGAIESALIKRPFPNNRHWVPGETVEQLEAENAANEVQ